ncbi:MAG: ribulose-phosphate 3-epimerase [Clostridiaceae bacterium]
MIKIAPSLLGADIGSLNSQLAILEANEIDMLHIDMMDGNFVPNIAFGPDQIEMLRKKTNLIFDVHMMVSEPDRFIPRVAEAGADIITVHVEASKHIHRSIQLIKSLGKKAGIVLNPGTSLETVKFLLNDIDMILIMTVNPGYGGQKFNENMLEKIKEVKKLVQGYQIDIQVDGGINDKTLAQCIKAGANIAVVGSYTFNGDIKTNIEILREVINNC